MPHKVSFATKDDLLMEIDTLGPKGVITEDAGNLHLLYTEGCKESPDIHTSYDRFRSALSARWGVEVNPQTAYLILEAVFKVTGDAKKKHFSLHNSTSSESKPPTSAQEKSPT